MGSTWLGLLNGAFAGAFVIAAAFGAWLYRRDGGGRSFLWASGLSLLLAVVLAAGAVSILRQGALAYPVSLGVRDIVQGVAAVVAVRTLAALVPTMRVRWLVRALSAVVVVHAVLYMATDTIVRHPLRPGADPQYGPYARITVLYGIATVAAAVLAAVYGDRPVRRWLAGVAPLVLAAAAGSMLVTAPVPRDEFTTLASAAVGLGVLGLSVQRMRGIVRSRDALLRREAALTELAFVAVEQPDILSVTAAAQQLLRDELGEPGLTVVLGDDSLSSSVRTEDGVVGVTVTDLDEVDRPWVDTVLRLVAGALGRARAEDEVRRRATHHPVTGLPNEVLFLNRVAAWVGAGTPCIVVVCRVRGLDTLAAVDGLDAEDVLLRELSAQLQDSVGPRRMVAHLSSGLFGILSTTRLPVTDPLAAGRITERITALRELILRLVQPLGLDVAIGAALSTGRVDAEQVLRDATAALARAAESGTDFEMFDPLLGDRLRGTAALARRLSRAVDRDEVSVEYQPVVATDSREVRGFEALARWRDGGELVTPSTWVPAAEANGLIGEIGRRVLAVAGRDFAQLRTNLAVNVSPLQLAAPDFAASTLAALGDCPPSRIVIEVTESAVMRDLDHAVAQLGRLRAAGIRIALDDFGTSYSSLSALADLPVDILKIDRSFVSRLDTTAGRAVVQAVVTMARALDKLTVAEGVETALQFAQLAELGVDRIQGFLVARPMPLDEAAAWPRLPSPYRRSRDAPPV